MKTTFQIYQWVKAQYIVKIISPLSPRYFASPTENLFLKILLHIE